MLPAKSAPSPGLSKYLIDVPDHLSRDRPLAESIVDVEAQLEVGSEAPEVAGDHEEVVFAAMK